MRLNLGSHNKRIEGYLNVDALDLPNVDIRHDLTIFPYPFETDSAEEILMIEVLEHISFRETDAVLKECLRILKPGSKIHIQVPDCGEMMFCFWNGQICDCVPHKIKNIDEAKALLNCPKCNGYGRVHPNRWLYAFLGAQKHEYDIHRNLFTKERLESYLKNAGFNKINFLNDPLDWKIKVDCYK